MGYSLWGLIESDTTELLTHTYTHTHGVIKRLQLRTVYLLVEISANLIKKSYYIFSFIKHASHLPLMPQLKFA